MSNQEIIRVNNIRILTPSDFEMLKDEIDKAYLRRYFLINFWSGMRYAEFQRLYEHKEWYWRSRNTIHLDRFAAKKEKRTQLERNIHPLPDLMPELMHAFFEDKKPPTLQTWDRNLKRWALAAGFEPFEYTTKEGDTKETLGISAKTTRKTIESWMILAGVSESTVFLRQGHDRLTSLNHYLGLPFTPAEVAEIKRRLAWMRVE